MITSTVLRKRRGERGGKMTQVFYDLEGIWSKQGDGGVFQVIVLYNTYS